MSKLLHIFSAQNIRILYIESTKTVNEMTLNKLVKLMNNFEQLGPEILVCPVSFVCVCWKFIYHSLMYFKFHPFIFVLNTVVNSLID